MKGGKREKRRGKIVKGLDKRKKKNKKDGDDEEEGCEATSRSGLLCKIFLEYSNIILYEGKLSLVFNVCFLCHYNARLVSLLQVFLFSTLSIKSHNYWEK